MCCKKLIHLTEFILEYAKLTTIYVLLKEYSIIMGFLLTFTETGFQESHQKQETIFTGSQFNREDNNVYIIGSLSK